MKKLIAALAALTMVFAAMMTVLAEEDVPTFADGVQFNMDQAQVQKLVNLPGGETDTEYRGTTKFLELEYEHVRTEDGFVADIKYLFVDDSLVAIRIDMEDGTGYDSVKDVLTRAYGETVPFDAAKIGNAKFIIDDDGDLKDCREMIQANGVTIVLERDHDGDVEITFFDPAAV